MMYVIIIIVIIIIIYIYIYGLHNMVYGHMCALINFVCTVSYRVYMGAREVRSSRFRALGGLGFRGLGSGAFRPKGPNPNLDTCPHLYPESPVPIKKKEWTFNHTIYTYIRPL